MYDIILVRYGEMTLKKKNYRQFLKKMNDNIKRKCEKFTKLRYFNTDYRFYIYLNGEDYLEVIKVLDTIVSMAPDRVVYVSCNPSTLARDLAYLDERGYKCIEIQPVDIFPHTMHVECVAKIIKK